MSNGQQKCDRCLAIDEIAQSIGDTYRDIHIAMANQDDSGVILSEQKLKGFHKKWDEIVKDECLCEVDDDEIPF